MSSDLFFKFIPNLFCIFSSKLTAPEGEMPDQAVASEHFRRRRHLPIPAQTELDRRARVGPNATVKGRHLGTEFAIYRRFSPSSYVPHLIKRVPIIPQDLLNFDDPLNIEAAEQYSKDKDKFQAKVREYVSAYARR